MQPRGRSPRALAAVLAGALCAAAHAHDAHDTGVPQAPPAPGYSALTYAPPVPGSYALPPIRSAADAEIIDDHGAHYSLHALYKGRITVLSFIYTQCSDANGCPLASFVLSQAAAGIAKDKTLASRVRFVSVSFDPARDTAAVLASYAQSFRKPGIEWLFATPATQAGLAPLLLAYGQDIERAPDGASYSHALRVYLIDGEGRVRNEYTSSFLHASTLRADIITLALSEQAGASAEVIRPSQSIGPGDDKRGYEELGYRTRSRALTGRDAQPAALLARLTTLPLGLPSDALNGPVPSALQVALGRRLFFDRRLSHNDTIACAGCHLPDHGYTNNELMTPIGIEGRTVKRNAPSLLNVGFLPRLFHDARESRLEQQVWSPLLAFNEMGNPSVGYVLDKLRELPEYAGLFEQAFPDEPRASMENLGAALAAYERVLVAGDSPFDRWRYGDDPTALPASARRGYELFIGKGGCSGCHLIGKHSALFTDHELHNTGIGYRRSMARPAPLNVQVAPGTKLPVEPETIAASSEAAPNDLGRYEVTLDPADRWRYRTPGLRNVALTAPYMHDGSLPALSDVIAFYDGGGVPNEGLDPLLKPLALTATERADLLAFLQSLTGSTVDALVRDAYAAPIGDRHSQALKP